MMLTARALAALLGRSPDEPDATLLAAHGDERAILLLGWLRARAGGEAARAWAAAFRMAAARDAVAVRRLSEAVAVLSFEGAVPLVLKGAALSYGFYPEPWLRARRDDDVLVAPEQFDRARLALEALGYVEQPASPSAEVTGQSHFTRQVLGEPPHYIDLHWRPLVPAAFADVPGHADLAPRSVPLAAIGDAARAPSAEDLLLLGCAHAVAHHGAGADPMWLVDAHQIASTLHDDDWRRFAERAVAARVATICRSVLADAAQLLGTMVPAETQRRLSVTAGEPSARYLRADSRLYRLWLDVHQRDARAVAARLAPSAAFMRAQYGVPSALLPFAYTWRLVAGASRWVAEAARRAGGR